jgi:hypothetical protein
LWLAELPVREDGEVGRVEEGGVTTGWNCGEGEAYSEELLGGFQAIFLRIRE